MRRMRTVLFLFSLASLLMCSVVQAGALTLLAPNGTTYLTSGSRFVIRWSDDGNTDRYNLSYSLDGGRRWARIAPNLAGSEYPWKVPVVARNELNCLVRVQAYRGGVLRGQDRSDRRFAILAARLAEPNGDETFMPGEVVGVSWKTFATPRRVASVSLSYTVDGGRTWRQMSKKKGNPGLFKWKIPATLTGKYPSCKVRVDLRDRLGRTLAVDTSDAVFSIGMVEVAADAAILDAASLGKLVSYDATLRELRFSDWTPQLRGLVPGTDTVVAGIVPGILPTGLLGKVMHLREETGTVVVTLVDPGLDSVFDNGTASYFHSLEPEDINGPLARVELEPGVTLLPRSAIEELDPEILAAARAAGFEKSQLFAYKIEKEVGSKTCGTDGCCYYAKIYGKIAVGVDFDISANIGWTGLKKFKVDTRPFVSSSLGVEAFAKCVTSEDWQLAHYQLTPWTFSIGPVPVVLVPYLDIMAGYDATAKVIVRLEARETLQAACGVDYKSERKPAWKSYWEPSSEFSLDAAAELNGAVRAWVLPMAGIRLYGLAGPQLSVEGYLELSGVVDITTMPPTTTLGVYAGLTPSFGGDIALFGWRKSVFFEFLPQRVLLWPRSAPPKVTLTASNGLEDRVALSWAGGEMTPLYEIWRAKVSPPEGYSLLAAVTESAYDDATAEPEYDYSYQVVGKNLNGTGVASDPATGWRKIKAPNPTISQGRFKEEIRIEWPGVEGAGGYAVYRDNPDVPDYQWGDPIQTLGPGSTSFSDKVNALVPAKHYTYKVTATGAGPHQSERTSLPLIGWTSMCDNPEGRWAVTIGPCGGVQQPATWLFTASSVILSSGCPRGRCTYDGWTWDDNVCSVLWGWNDGQLPPRAWDSWSGNMNNQTGQTITGTYDWAPIALGEAHPQCWTAQRLAPDPVDAASITAELVDNRFKISWGAVPGALRYTVEYTPGAEGSGWVPVIAGYEGTSYLVDYRPWYVRVRAENSVGQSAWTEKAFNWSM